MPRKPKFPERAKLPPAAALLAELQERRKIGSRLAEWCFILASREGCGADDRAGLMAERDRWNAIPEAAIDGRRKGRA